MISSSEQDDWKAGAAPCAGNVAAAVREGTDGKDPRYGYLAHGLPHPSTHVSAR